MPKNKRQPPGIFSYASNLRKKHPGKYRDWQDYVQWAKRELASRGHSKKKRRIGSVKKKRLRLAKNVTHCTVGSITFHKGQMKKQLEERLAWMLLARDQAPNKRARTKVNKKVQELRRQLRNIK